MRELVERGEFRPVIDRRYPLAEIAEAHRYAEAGHKKGNVIIVVADNDDKSISIRTKGCSG